ncbi:KAISO regulator, partial [Polypterus senegalus]
MDDEYVDLINKKAATVTEIALENAKNYLLDMHLQARAMASIKLISVADTHYQKTLLKSLNKQRLLGLFCDVTFIVQDHTYRAHKNILAAASSYFHQLFDISGHVIELNFIRPEIFEAILNYIYRSRIVRIRSDMLLELIKCGQKLGIKFISNLGVYLSRVKGIPGISKDDVDQEMTADSETKQSEEEGAVIEGRSRLLPVIIEDYSLSIHEFRQHGGYADDDSDSEDYIFFTEMRSKTGVTPSTARAFSEIIELDADRSKKAKTEEKILLGRVTSSGMDKDSSGISAASKDYAADFELALKGQEYGHPSSALTEAYPEGKEKGMISEKYISGKYLMEKSTSDSDVMAPSETAEHDMLATLSRKTPQPPELESTASVSSGLISDVAGIHMPGSLKTGLPVSDANLSEFSTTSSLATAGIRPSELDGDEAERLARSLEAGKHSSLHVDGRPSLSPADGCITSTLTSGEFCASEAEMARLMAESAWLGISDSALLLSASTASRLDLADGQSVLDSELEGLSEAELKARGLSRASLRVPVSGTSTEESFAKDSLELSGAALSLSMEAKISTAVSDSALAHHAALSSAVKGLPGTTPGEAGLPSEGPAADKDLKAKAIAPGTVLEGWEGGMARSADSEADSLTETTYSAAGLLKETGAAAAKAHGIPSSLLPSVTGTDSAEEALRMSQAAQKTGLATKSPSFIDEAQRTAARMAEIKRLLCLGSELPEMSDSMIKALKLLETGRPFITEEEAKALGLSISEYEALRKAFFEADAITRMTLSDFEALGMTASEYEAYWKSASGAETFRMTAAEYEALRLAGFDMEAHRKAASEYEAFKISAAGAEAAALKKLAGEYDDSRASISDDKDLLGAEGTKSPDGLSRFRKAPGLAVEGWWEDETDFEDSLILRTKSGRRRGTGPGISKKKKAYKGILKLGLSTDDVSGEDDEEWALLGMASIKLISVADSLYTGLLLKSLNKQRLLGLFCDVSFIIQDRMFKAHKNILSVASSFFHQLFKETGPVIELNFIKPDVFEAILDYIYLSKIIRVRSDLLGDLIKCGQILKIKFIANLGLILSQVKGIPGISKDFSPQDEAATFEMREPIKYFITHESSTDVIPVIIEEYSMTLHGLDWPEDFDYDDYDSLSFYPKVYSKSEKQPTSAKDYIKGTCRGTISAKGITEGSPALALTEIDLTASALASGVVDLSALASAGLAALTSTAGDLPALSLKECISTVPILKAAEMSHDLLSEAKTHSDVRSEFGVSPDVLSAFGISPDELSAFGISPDVLSAFGKSSDALSAFGKSSDALSPFGKSSDALSPFGKSSDALSAFGVSPDVLSELALERVGELPVVDLEDSEHLRTPSPMVETLEELEREFIKPEEEISIPSTLITDVKEVSTWPPSGVLTSGFPGVMDEEYMDLFNRQPTPFAQIAIGSAQSYLLDLHQRTKVTEGKLSFHMTIGSQSTGSAIAQLPRALLSLRALLKGPKEIGSLLAVTGFEPATFYMPALILSHRATTPSK